MLTPEKQRLLENNMGLLQSIASREVPRYRGMVTYEELLSSACYGAMLAIESWRERGGASVATWVATRARGQIIDDVRRRSDRNRRTGEDRLSFGSEHDEGSYCSTVVEDDDALNELVRRLAAGDGRKSMILRMVADGIQCSAIADAVGVSESCVHYILREVRNAARSLQPAGPA